MIVHMCDVCEEQIVGNSYVTIGVPTGDDAIKMTIVECCGTNCVQYVLAQVFDEAQVDLFAQSDDDQPVSREPAVQEELPLEPKLTPKLSNQERIENERKYRKEAEGLTEAILGVQRRGFN